MTGIAALTAVVWAVLMARIELVTMRMYQLEEYDAQRLLRWYAKTPKYAFHRTFLGMSALVAFGLLYWRIVGNGWVVWVLALSAPTAGHALWQWTAEKKALVKTARARRLLFVSRAVVAVLAALGVLACYLTKQVWPVDLVVLLSPIVGGVGLIAANILLWPYELRSRAQFRDAAAAKLADIGPLVVAVAGSYGKTTTKRLIAQALDDGGDTLPTPKSFNTLLGLTKTLNEDLNPQHQVFVAEMDAYNPGEIKAMCRLTNPQISVLASVGPMHLERFKTTQRIADSLYEVVQGLQSGGSAVIHVGNEAEAAVAARSRADGVDTTTYALAPADADVLASAVELSIDGTRFHLSWPKRGLEKEVFVPLLGRHQALNATAAIAVTAIAGRDVDTAVANLAHAQPVEHRLQIVPSGNGVTVIDDSYNANPIGVHNALEVLQSLDVRKRILVTPGLVELGDQEEAENRRYGEHAARVCDDLIVVKARSAEWVSAGAAEGGLSSSHIHLVDTLDEATGAIGRLAAPGDVVLFANDLPDTY